MARKLLIAASIALSAVIVLWVAAELYWSSKYIDETITAGQRWGVTIGDRPDETLRKLKAELAQKNAKVVRSPGTSSKREHLGLLADVDASQLDGANQIYVFWDGDAVSDLSLEFRDGRLVSAHMKQQAFELP